MIPRRQLFGVVAVVVLVGAAMTAATTTASGMSASAASTAAATTFTDPAGDSQGAPDVTKVVIGGDAATAMITFEVTVTGLAMTSQNGLEQDVLAWLDTDKNRATGDPADGTEYALQSWVDSAGRWWNVSRWNGSEFEKVPQSATQSFSRKHFLAGDDVLTWTVNASDLGGATSFRFYVEAGTFDVAAHKYIARDDAPDSGWWDFDLSATTPVRPTTTPSVNTVALKIRAPTTTPRQAIAGKRFTVSFPVMFEKHKTITTFDAGTGETSTGVGVMVQPVPGGKMVCDPSVAGKVIAHAESFKNGQARLSFVVPKTAKGNLLTVKVKITATDRGFAASGKTVTATKISTFRVR